MKWLKSGKGGGRPDDPPDVDGCILAGRLEEAVQLLEARLARRPRDRHARLKLADVRLRLGRSSEAVAEYLTAADGFAQDGFRDKAIAVLGKVHRLVPGDQEVEKAIQRLREAKRIEGMRGAAVGGLLASLHRAGPRSRAIRVQRLWENLGRSELLHRLTETEIKRLFEVLEPRWLEPGERLTRQGERRREMLLLAEGEVEARLELRGKGDHLLRSFEEGDLLGEAALLEHRVWPATYVSKGGGLVLRLTSRGLQAALEGMEHPRRFLDILRSEGRDGEVARLVLRLRS